ncbi:NarK family nitrate/nitrite MFS transporter [Synechococcus sp. PCC 6312]|uniref:NarK family nitrate/nitrite MFS transporter n=1 Tax=Synechococcus sp. (strain ATCC 27167 / PCC 6312) TaxID=195253 RepID=UPI00029F2553|nr:NarK family nitrate/nitrite MFS transporter [Synechococcus sp. PCC 6312]AFY60290.1 nitrite extrusion protein, nitrite facilitator [Synechococcus sp. PCC 6312]
MLRELFSFRDRYRILHLTWFAFFLTFVVWFNLAPLSSMIKADLGLTTGQIRTLAICNVALTVPARIIIGMILDRYGPRITYSCLLGFAAIPCVMFAMAQDFYWLVISRLLLSIVGAGFVIGIRLVSEWFPPKEIGVSQGIYAGWGNFGSAAAAFALPSIALGLAFFSGGEGNWRLTIALTGIAAAIYGVIYYLNVTDTPAGKVYQKPQRHGGIEVTSIRDFWLMLATNIPLNAVLGLLAWRLEKVGLIDAATMGLIWIGLVGLYLFQSYKCWDVNKALFTENKRYPATDRYRFGQVFLLELTYIVNFGSELAVVSMLPTFFESTYGLPKAYAGMIAASYAGMVIIARPGGGVISDRFGSRKWTMVLVTAGMGLCYLFMAGQNSTWWLPVALMVTAVCGFFVHLGTGSTFSIVPLIKRRVTGQIAGNVGAYGNVGAVCYTTLYSLLPEGAVGNQIFFQTLGVAALIVTFLCVFFLREPQGSFAAHHEGELLPLEPGLDSDPIILTHSPD